MSDLRIAFAGDRDIAVKVLRFLLGERIKPLALLVSGEERASHADELVALCGHLAPREVLRGKAFREPVGIELLERLDPVFIICIHFPYIVPEAVLRIPRGGVLNLHPAYLPYNRGWHTASWAIMEQTPYGATLHFMDAGLDTGDIVHQRLIEVSPGDTAHSLYQRVKTLEMEVFKEAWPLLVSGQYERKPQQTSAGTNHKKKDLLVPQIQRINLEEKVQARELIRWLRALTTSRTEEAAYYEVDGKRYRVQVKITEEPEQSA